MPSFLSKVFARKKDEKDVSSTSNKRASNASLLEGKYEAVSPSVSPSATKFLDPPQQPSGKESSNPLSLFRSRSRNPVEQPGQSNANTTSIPTLTLNLPVPKEEKSRALGVVFEADPDSNIALSDAVIGERKLNPLETLLLVKACSGAIINRGGLETLGLMHPHWYSSSPDVQRKLVSLFILSLASKTQSPITTLSPTPASLSQVFSSELEYTRSSHDIAAVLRWALRHLRLEGSSFGSAKDAGESEWAWYKTFTQAERDATYPPDAFSKKLVPLLPPAHLQLLTVSLDIISSLAAHAEGTGTSGSKLSMLFGLWLVAAQRTKVGEEWAEFYKRWERAGRVLEHLFLAHLREEASGNKLPLRLSELVKQYPYGHVIEPADGLPLLPRSRFSTRRYDALFVRIDTQLPSTNSKRPAREHPLRLISEALKAATDPDATISSDANSIWEEIKTSASEDQQEPDAYPVLTRIFDDETLRLLSLVPGDPISIPTSPSFTLTPPPSQSEVPVIRSPQPARRRSTSLGPANGNGKVSANGHGRDATVPIVLPPTNWADFSMIGFGESLVENNLAATLERDVEVTAPPPSSWSGTKKRRASSPGRSRRSSADNPRPVDEARGRAGAAEEIPRKPFLTQVSTVQIDEAFFEFWSDSLLDPVSSSWPAFVVCQLKPSTWKVNLLVIEHSYTYPPPPPPPIPSDKRASSPRPSLSSNVSGRKSFAFSTKRRFSLFSTHSNSDAATSKTVTQPRRNTKSSRTPRIGEMGEILPEEPSVPAQAESKTEPEAKSGGSEGLGLTGVPSAALAISVNEPTTSEAPVGIAAVPIVSVEGPSAAPEVPTPVATEPVKTEEEAPEKPTVHVPDELPIAADAVGADTFKTLPPTPEPVLASGATPGPELALSSSEPAALVEVAAHKLEQEQESEVNGASPTPVEDEEPTAVENANWTAVLEPLPTLSALPELASPAPVDPPTEVVQPTTGNVDVLSKEASPETVAEPAEPVDHVVDDAEEPEQEEPIEEPVVEESEPTSTLESKREITDLEPEVVAADFPTTEDEEKDRSGSIPSVTPKLGPSLAENAKSPLKSEEHNGHVSEPEIGVVDDRSSVNESHVSHGQDEPAAPVSDPTIPEEKSNEETLL
ncbi:hypothetical protein PHLCEN_2v12475 [Hermanssonia centrifuga]|uniref:Meiotically up-regulated protein Msb1/Mug8 domain-containing protein n=1 Tax=Hermanssonia centrifuga TaxID=98765 RepID=A0A2R6NI21_9APHY|nr:hypothetical protein PHLCEN_2v12475 [Hermanssonia centrifuga]